MTVPDKAELKDRLDRATQRVHVATEKVVQASLFCASDHFNEQAEDPGWTAEMHEDMLADAIVEAAAEINVMQAAEKEFKFGGPVLRRSKNG